MSTIQRYLAMDEHPLRNTVGDYVLYTDHCAALAAVEKERDEVLAVLREQIDMHGKPHRGEWLSSGAYVDALELYTRTLALLARHAPKEARE